MISWLRDWLRAKKTGFIAQEEDKRDYKYEISGSSDYPSMVDHRPLLLSCRNQFDLEACAGFATASMIEFLLAKHNLKVYVSPLYNWYYSKKYHGWEEQNKGVWLRNSLKAIYKYGFVADNFMPLKPDYLRRPDLISENFAISFKDKFLKFTEYQLLNSYQMKDALQEGCVVFGLKINNSFYGNRTGIIKDITPNSYSHAMIAVGYDDSIGCYIVRNSWGDSSWGDKGYCYIPYNYFKEYAHDIWTIKYKR